MRRKDGVHCAAKKQTANANFEMAKKELLTMQKFTHPQIVNVVESFHDR